MRNDLSSLPIGIFDSGVGGLTVMREVMRLLPHENIIYFGDTARVPYGTRSPETIIRYTREGISFLLECGIKLLIMACHTACAQSFNIMKEEFSIPMLGVIESGCQQLIHSTKRGRVAVLGTSSTIKSGIHKSFILEFAPHIEVFPVACPLFVPLIEEGFIDHHATSLIAEHYLTPLKEHKIDAALLACTHYPLLHQTIQKILGPEISLIEPAEITARKSRDLLAFLDLQNKDNIVPDHKFYASDDPDKFSKLANFFLGSPVNRVATPPCSLSYIKN